MTIINTKIITKKKTSEGGISINATGFGNSNTNVMQPTDMQNLYTNTVTTNSVYSTNIETQNLSVANNAKMNGTTTFGNYNKDISGAVINNDGTAEFQSLKLRESLIVPEIQYNHQEVFSGIQWNSFGGGVIERVDIENETTGVITLKLDKGQVGMVDVGDMCMCIFHDESGTNDTEDMDDRQGTFKFKGFNTIYFYIDSLVDKDNLGNTITNRSKFKYVLRTGYTKHPSAGAHFVCYANSWDNKPDRKACKYTTTEYEIRLVDMTHWTFTDHNIISVSGKLDGFHRGTDYFSGYGSVIGNAYIYGTVNKVNGEPIFLDLNIASGYDNEVPKNAYTFIEAKLMQGFEQIKDASINYSYTFDGTTYTGTTNQFVKVEYEQFPIDNRTMNISVTTSYDGHDYSNSLLVKKYDEIRGPQGPAGPQGEVGRGITYIESYYFAYNTNNIEDIPAYNPIAPEWSMTMPVLNSTDRFLWQFDITHYNKEPLTTLVTPYVAAVYGDKGNTGGIGKTGPSYRLCGKWNETKQYVKDRYNIDVVLFEDEHGKVNYYQAKKTSVGIKPNTSTTYWMASDKFDFIATDLLLSRKIMADEIDAKNLKTETTYMGITLNRNDADDIQHKRFNAVNIESYKDWIDEDTPDTSKGFVEFGNFRIRMEQSSPQAEINLYSNGNTHEGTTHPAELSITPNTINMITEYDVNGQYPNFDDLPDRYEISITSDGTIDVRKSFDSLNPEDKRSCSLFKIDGQTHQLWLGCFLIENYNGTNVINDAKYTGKVVLDNNGYLRMQKVGEV